jgi:hypothetical protein
MTVMWLAALVIVVLMALGVSRALRPGKITDQDFEREARRPSLIRTGLQEFQGFLEPEKKAAVEVIEQERRKTDSIASGDPSSRTRRTLP